MAREMIAGTVTHNLSDPAILRASQGASITAEPELSIPVDWFAAYPWLFTFNADGTITINASNGPFDYSVVGMARNTSNRLLYVWADLVP